MIEPTPAEQRVLAAFQAGKPTADVARAKIRGDFLRGLFLGEYDKEADYRGTCIENAIISDVLDMEFRETKFPMRFHNCSFVREICLQQLTCPELDFRGCTLIGNLDARMAKVAGSVNMTRVVSVAPVSFANAEIGGQLVCTGGNFLSKEGCAFHAPDVKVTADVLLRDGFMAVGEVNLAGADIGRQLVCTGGNFWNGEGNAINAQSIKAGGVLLNTDSSDNQNINEFRAIGTVWLASADIRGQLDCRGGNFHNKGKIALNAESTKVAGSVTLSDGFNAEGVVSLAGAEIGGQFACAGGSFLGCFWDKERVALKAHSIKVANDVILGDGFNAEGTVTLLGSVVGGQIDCAGGNFQNAGENALIAQNIKVAGDVRLGDGFKAEGMVTLLGANFGGQLICSGGNFRNKNGKALIAQGINVAGNVFLSTDDSNSSNIKKFEAVGAVSLAYADIKGQLACNGGIFRNKGKDAIDARGIKVAGEVLLRDGFKADGEVSFLGADVGRQFVCIGGTFLNEKGNALVAQGIKVGAGACLGAGFNAKGAVTLAGAEIRGQLDCSGGNFQNQDGVALNAQGIKVASEVFLIPHVNAQKEEKFSANGLVSFTNATIGGSFLLKGCNLARLSLSGANVLGEFQDDADAYKLDKIDDIDLNIDGFRYQRLDTTKERVKDRLVWVGSMSKGDKFYPQPYEQLMKVYREMGHMNWARRVGFELEKKRRKVKVPGWWKVRDWLLRITIGYGYKPLRFLGWFPIAIVGGWLLFSGALCSQKWTSPSVVASALMNGITEQSECEYWRMLPTDVGALLSPSWRDSKVPPDGYPKFIPLFYAIEVALPVLPLGQTSHWQPKSIGLKWIQEIIIIIGAVALAIPASYRTGFLNPKWWDK